MSLSRVFLVLGVILFIGLIIAMVLFAFSMLGADTVSDEEFSSLLLTIDMFIVLLAFVSSFVFLVTLPIWMIIAYQSTQQEVLQRKVTQDLWLCGLGEEHLLKKQEDFNARNRLSEFLLPLLGILILSFLLWGITFMPAGISGLSQTITVNETSNTLYLSAAKILQHIVDESSLITWVFLGAYFYAMNSLLRRWLLSDITAGILWKINIRFAFAMVIGLLFIAVWPDAPRFLAFFAGIIPDIALWLMSEQVKKIFNIREASQIENESEKVFGRSELQNQISGLNFWQADRLAEEGIESVQNLATEDIPDMLIRTRFKTQHLLDWIDQAIFINQVGVEKYKVFASIFIKTASDFQDRAKDMESMWKSIETLAEEDRKGISLPALYNLDISLQQGPNLAYVQEYWKNTRSPEDRKQKLQELAAYQAHIQPKQSWLTQLWERIRLASKESAEKKSLSAETPLAKQTKV